MPKRDPIAGHLSAELAGRILDHLDNAEAEYMRAVDLMPFWVASSAHGRKSVLEAIIQWRQHITNIVAAQGARQAEIDAATIEIPPDTTSEGGA
jgi:hypothetical protein